MDNLLVVALALLLIVALGIQFMLLGIPFFQRMSFDARCHQALMQMDHQGGMTAAIYSQLESDLISRGFLEPVIHGNQEVPFGEEISLYVEASVVTRHLLGNFQQTTRQRTMIYENAVLSRHLLTAAGEP